MTDRNKNYPDKTYGSNSESIKLFNENTLLKIQVKELEETIELLKQEMNRRSEANKAEWDLAREILADPRKVILDEAWNRVCFGKVLYDENRDFNAMKMFDYPRYTWDELHDLIKGIKK